MIFLLSLKFLGGHIEMSFLSKFKYSEYETGYDSLLRVGDYITMIVTNSHNNSKSFVYGRIVEHEIGIPCFLINSFKNNPENSGFYYSIFEAFLRDYKIVRIPKETWFKNLLD